MSAARAGLARNTLLMAGGTLASRALGVIRVMLLVAAIGQTSRAANAFDVANTLPNIINIVLAGGVLNAVLVPQLTKAMKHADGGQDFTDRLLTLAMSVIAVTTLLVIVASPALVWLYGSQMDEGSRRLATAFAFVCLPQVFFYGLHTLIGQVLNSRERFGAYMWSPALANLVGIVGLLLFIRWVPEADRQSIEAWTPGQVWLLAGSFTAGIVLQALVLFPSLRAIGFGWRPRWGFRGVGLGSASKVAAWSFATIALSQVGFVVISNVLSRVPEGLSGKASYSNAFMLFMLPHSLLTVSLVTAMFPGMARKAADSDRWGLAIDVRNGVRSTAALMVPVAVLMMLFGAGATAVLASATSPEETRAMGLMLAAMAIGLPAYAAGHLFQRLFYAFEDARTPFMLQVVSTGVSVVTALATLLLPLRWVGVGIGLSQTAAALVAAVAGAELMRRRLPMLRRSDMVRTYVQLSVASALAALATVVVVLGVGRLLGLPSALWPFGGVERPCPPASAGQACGPVASVAARGELPGILLYCVLGALVFMTVYAMVARRLRVREVNDLLSPVLRRVSRLLPGR